MKVLPVEEYPQLTPPELWYQLLIVELTRKYCRYSCNTAEDAINGVEDMIYMQSAYQVHQGEMSLSVYFEIGTDPAKPRL